MFFMLVLVTISLISSEDIKDLNVNELIKLGEDISQIRPDDVKEKDVNFYLLTRNISTPLHVKKQNIIVDSTKNTKFLVHGWLENHRRTWYKELSEQYLINGDYNIVQIDWEWPARSSYVSSSQNTKIVGKFVAKFILSLNISFENVHIIGHSLGSHVAGFAGKELLKCNGQKISRITALDPAGPYFRNSLITPDEKLNKNDAVIVDAIHTDAGFYGYEEPIGTLDIYANGGSRIQPGCLDDFTFNSFGAFIEDSFCSHHRSCLYFIESINMGKLYCRKCNSWENFINGKCNSQQLYILRAEEINEKHTGVCFIKTNSRKPYLPQN